MRVSIDVAERRARLARRHRLTADDRADDVMEAARSVVALHATDPATVYLSAWARVAELEVSDMERALYEERSLVKHLAMRRTLFVLPREILPVVQAGASNRVAENERRRLIRDVEKAGLRHDGAQWLRDAEAEVCAALSDGREATAAQLRAEISELSGGTLYGQGKPWGGEVPVGPRVLNMLSAAGVIVRAHNDGAWTSSRPRWALLREWLGEEIAALPEERGVERLTEQWLRRFGPGTVTDIKWWLGCTVGAVRRALADLNAVEVDLQGQTGYELPDDLELTDPPEPWAALLPALDPTTMGWAERDWYLGPHREWLFDRSGNAGATAWWDGRVVGGWRQDGSGEVELQLVEDVGSDGRRVLEEKAAQLTQWLGGTRVLPRFPSPLSKS
jgi:hypothetical protein